MKTILMLTDFSPQAAAAANYAFRLATRIHANVMLYHAFTMPDPSDKSYKSWSVEDYFLRKESLATTLSAWAERLVNSAHPSSGDFTPTISCASELGELTDAVQSHIFANHDVVLAVVGIHGRHRATRLLFENNVNRMLSMGMCPVLVVPEGAAYEDPSYVCFATDFSRSHMRALHSLSSLCTHFGSEISLVWVSNKVKKPGDIPDAVRDFLTEVSTAVGYPKLYYRPVRNRFVVNGLYRSSLHGPCDLFVLVHRVRSRWYRITKGSTTRQLIHRVEMPLLVFPEAMASYPVF
ncbi:universal stress protein [Parapedobacter defluvii]|uniref:universal stress protein n=1 Tax=Parapedobacter defluvii TaxID=2045106 RepID=UPI00333F00B8